MKRAKGLRLAALALGGAVLLSGCVTRTEPSVSTQIFVMDTIMSLELWEGGSQEQLNQAVEQLYQWEDLWSATDEDSEIWAADHSGGEWVTLSGDTVDLLSQALDLCRLTGGALDLTAYSAVKAWGFTTGEYRVPEEEELAALKLLNPNEDITAYFNCLDTYVYFRKNGEIYRRYLEYELNNFYDNTGFEIEGE